MSDFKVTHKIEIELVEYISAKTFNSARGDAEALGISHMYRLADAVQKIPNLTRKEVSRIIPVIVEVSDDMWVEQDDGTTIEKILQVVELEDDIGIIEYEKD